MKTLFGLKREDEWDDEEFEEDDEDYEDEFKDEDW